MTIEIPPITAAWRLLSPRQVAEKLGVSGSTIERLIGAPGFPKSVPITDRRIDYLKHEIAGWIGLRSASR